MAFSSIAGLRAPQLTAPAVSGPPTRRYAISAVFGSRWEEGSRARRETERGGTIVLQLAAAAAAAASSSSSSSSPSPTSSSSFFSSLPEGCLLVDAADARALGGIPLNALVVIPDEKEEEEEEEGAEEEEEGAEEEGEGEEGALEPGEAGDLESVAVAVLRSSDALDLSAAARQLGWPRARLAPRSAVPRLLRWRFAPGGVPPLGHAEGVETLVCSSVVVSPARGEERGGEEGDGGGPSGSGVSFVAGGGGPALRLVFRGRDALAAAMQAEGAAVVVGLGVERPPLVLPLPPLAAAAAAADSSAGEDADGPSASSPSAADPPQVRPAYSSPPPLFVDDAAGVRAVAELLLPPLRQPSGEEAPTTTEESGGARGTSVGNSGDSGGSGGARSNRQRWHLLGLDAEWVPETERGRAGRHPVETLQLATTTAKGAGAGAAAGAAAVLDVAALCRSREGSEALVALLARAATAGTGTQGNGPDSTRVLFVGHTARQDLVRLARTVAEASAARGEGPREGSGGGESGESGDGEPPPPPPPPPLPLLTVPSLPIHSVDLPSLARWAVSPPGALVPAGRLPGGHGLANLVRTFLGGAALNKDCQRSDWGLRPLSARQLAYAAADAHATAAVAERILGELRPELASTRKRAAAHSGGLAELDGGWSRSSRGQAGAGRSPKGGGGRKGSPPPPPALAPGPAREARRAAREERQRREEGEGDLDGGGSSSLFSSSSKYLERGAARGSGRRKDADDGTPAPKSSGGSAADADADVEGLLRDFLGLPLPGKGGRGLAVAAALGLLLDGGGGPGEPLSPRRRRRGGDGDGDGEGEGEGSLPQHLLVPRFDRGGVARLRNACVLFVNLDAGGGGGASRYPNEFVEEGGETRLTWFPSPGQGESHPLVRRLLSSKVTGGDKHHVLLFCRLRSAKTNGPFYFLGRLGDPRVDWGDGEGFDDLGGDGGDDDDGGEGEEQAILDRASSPSSPRMYPARFAWKLLDAKAAAERGGRGVEALFEAGSSRRKRGSTATATATTTTAR